MLCDKIKDVNQSADKCLKDFLFEIDNVFEKLDKDTTNKILEIIIDQCKSTQDASKQIGFDWLLKFLKKYNSLLNTLSFKNIRYHNKYYKKLVNSKDRLSNVVTVRRNINLNDSKIDKKILTQSFNEQYNKGSYFKNEKLFGLEDEKKVYPIKPVRVVSGEHIGNKNHISENNCIHYDKNKEDNIVENHTMNLINQISFKNGDNDRNSAYTILDNIADSSKINIINSHKNR